MTDQGKTEARLTAELEELRRRVSELEQSENERRQAEKALQESEKRFKLAAETASDLIYEWDVQNDKLDWFGDIDSTLGFQKGEISKTLQSWLERIHPDDLEKMKDAVELHRNSTKPIYEEYRVKTKDGSWLHWIDRASPILNESGKPQKWIGVCIDITKRRLAEEALQEGEEKYRTIINESPVGIFYYSSEGIITECNKKFVEIIGSSYALLIGMNMPKQLKDKNIIKAVNLSLKDGYGYYEDWYHSVTAAKKSFLRILLKGIRDRNNKIIAGLGLVEDITERRQAETALQENEKKYRTLFTQIANPIFIFDKDTHLFLDCNQSALDLYGYTIEELRYMTPRELHPLEEIAKVNRNIIDENDSSPNYYSHITKTGKIIKVEINTGHTEYEGKDAWISIIHDVTDQGEAELALRESEEKYRLIVENAHDGIEITQDDRIIFANSRFAEMLGYTSDELTNIAFSQVFTEQATQDLNQRQLKRKTGSKISHQYETSFRKKDGTSIDVDVKYEIIDYKGKPATFAIIRDITGLKKTEKEKGKLEEQLRRTQKLETIGTLAGGIAHDFNNILAPIMGYADMALLNLKETDELYADIKQILNGAYRAKDLVDQILLFAKQSEKEWKPLRLQSLIKETLKLLRPSIPATIQIKQNIDDSCGKILADAAQIHQVVVNLCTNAWQAIEHDGTLSIELVQKSVDAASAKLHPNLNEAEYVCLSIVDSGTGMDEHTLERIFEPFYTTKDVDKGTGLGLSVVHGIIRSHKGDILVDSEPGKGTAFHVYLPVIKPKRPSDESKETKIMGGTEFIMIVDDESAIAEMVKKILENFGYKADIYKTGQAAIDALRNDPEKYNLLLSDLTMPQMTGLDLAELVHKEYPDFPVVIMTGFDDAISAVEKKNFKIKEVIGKPIVIKELTETLRNALNNENGGD